MHQQSLNRWRQFDSGTLNMLARIMSERLTQLGYEAPQIQSQRSIEDARRRYSLGMQV